MPHSVVHIIDNSMYKGQLPVTVVDDPSLYATIVVSGAPMGADNEMIPINRSDVVNVAYGLANISAKDIKRYGQSVTYPAALLAQDAPVKFMRVTPDDATYAFSCLIMEWRWDTTDNKMHVRFKTSEDPSISAYDGLPAGLVLSNFKNPARLNAALVNGFKKDNVQDGAAYWTRRVLLTEISAGRGSEYNKFNYVINQTQQSKRPANVRYSFATVDTSTTQTVENFYASLVNENNTNRSDAIDSVNVVVGKRIKGSSILVPTINESAVKELYDDYMSHFKDMIDIGMIPTNGSFEFAQTVFKTLNLNIFDPIYGRYVYNGDTDVLLPYFQVDMYDTSLPQLSTSNRITAVLKAGETPDDYVENPTDLQELLYTKTKGIAGSNADDYVHVGDVYLTSTSSLSMALVTSINQYTGAVSVIPITSVHTATSLDIDATNDIQPFKGYVSVNDKTDENEIKSAIQYLVTNKKLIPRIDPISSSSDPTYIKDAVIIGINNVNEKNDLTGLNTFGIGIVSYTSDGSGDITVDTVTRYYSNTDLYSRFVYPSTIVSMFATRSPNESGGTPPTAGTSYWNTPGATIIDINKSIVSQVVNVYVNEYDRTDSTSSESAARISVNNNKPFMIGVYPQYIKTNENIVGTSYDCLIYDNDTQGINFKIVGTFKAIKTSEVEHEVDETLKYVFGEGASAFTAKFKISSISGNNITVVPVQGSDTSTKPIPYGTIALKKDSDDKYAGLSITIGPENIEVSFDPINKPKPIYIKRYIINGTYGSLFRYTANPIEIPADYYEDTYGINPSSEVGGISINHGYTGFFDDNISDIEFKWKYSELLVKAFRGEKDPRIQSPTRCPAKYLFDGATNTIVGQTILPYIKYKPIDIINASTVFTDDEKEAIQLDNSLIANIKEFTDIDVKQAMYDLMEIRCYNNIPEDKRPIGPGSGLSLHLDSGVTDINTAKLVNSSFTKRFNNPNASWDIGGYVSSADGVAYTYTKALVDNMFAHIKQYSVNKPYIGKYSSISSSDYVSFFPDIDTGDWELRELMYKSGGNAWMVDVNGNLQRKSQRTLYREGDTSDLIQENNMRTLSQLVYILQNKIDTYLLEYNDDGVLKTLKDEVDNLFSNWVGNLVQALDITFERDINPDDGGEIVVCYCNVTFRGLILRVPIIVNVQRRTDSE